MLSPFYAEIPVRYWDGVVNVGKFVLLAGTLGLIVGCVADAIRTRTSL
ncbi:hypothetical protein M728_003243 [Ensifer sp. WSM1721]